MTTQETLKIFERDNTITTSKLRSIGYIPATVYGKEVEPFSFQIKAHEFELALARGIRQFALEGVGPTLNAQVKQLQKENTQEKILHVEFFVPSQGGSKQKAPKAAVAQESRLEEAVSVH